MSVTNRLHTQFLHHVSNADVLKMELLSVFQGIEGKVGWRDLKIDVFVGNVVQLNGNDEALAHEVQSRFKRGKHGTGRRLVRNN